MKGTRPVEVSAEFFTGVPDSKLRPLVDYLMDTYGSDGPSHIIAANEGSAAALAAGWLLGLAARGADGGLSDTDLGSDLAGGHAGGLQIEYLLLLRCADRTAGRVADTAGRRGLARLLGGRYASRARFWSHLSRDETLAEGEQG